MTRFAPLSLRLVQPEWADVVPSPAHDSLSATQRVDYVRRHPDSYLRVTGAGAENPDTAPPTAEVLHQRQRSALDRLLGRGAFGATEPSRFYLYELDQRDPDGNTIHRQSGLVGGIAVADYETGELKRHERIRSDRARQLEAHLAGIGFQSSPVAAAHRPNTAVTAAGEVTKQQPPIVEAHGEDGLVQRVWAVDDPDIGELLADTPTYLIDGHHRAAAAALWRSSAEGNPAADWLLAAVFSTHELDNHAFHRVLRGRSLDEVLSSIGERFAVRLLDDPDARRADEIALWGFHDNGQRWMGVTIPHGRVDGLGDEIENLDTMRLDRQLLGPVLGLDAEAEDAPITYHPDNLGLDALESMAAEADGTLCLTRPVPVETILRAADAGLVLPPKSTYFEPKIRSGVFLRPLR